MIMDEAMTQDSVAPDPAPTEGERDGDVGDRAAPSAAGKAAKKGATAHKGKAMLPVVVGDGLQIESDGGAMRADGTLHLLSLWGPASPARYLAAQLATGKRLDIQLAPPVSPFTPLWGSTDRAYKKLRRGVSARLSHTLVIARACDATRLDAGERSFLVTLRRDRLDQTAETVYTAFLIALLDEPVTPAWAEWLWRRARAKGEARPLVAWGPALREAWECDVPTTLRADISAARAGDSPYGALPLPEIDAAA